MVVSAEMGGSLALLLVVLVSLGVFGALCLRRWLLSPPGSARRKVVWLGASVCVLVTVALAPELLSYPVYAEGLMHFPVLGRVAVLAVALFCLGFFVTVAVLLWRRGLRAAGATAGVLGLLPLPVHLLEMVALTEVLGVHFFTR